MKPKISTHYPLNYEEVLSNTKFALVLPKCGNCGSKNRPVLVYNHNRLTGKMKGYEIAIYNNGIHLNGNITFWGLDLDANDASTITEDANKLICDWLISMGEKNLIINENSWWERFKNIFKK